MIAGIDLGTTNSLIAIWDAGTVKVIPNALGKLLTPSVVSIENDMILIGEPALNRLVTHPEYTIANFKRFMGSDKTIKLGRYSFRPEELSALILKRLKEDAEIFLGHEITEAVISVPAYFSDAQRKATKNAGKLAGIKVERLINEPTAAGITYGLHDQMDDINYLIFDLGGGTFDVSILTMFSGIIEVRASCGDNFLGGIDFTKILEEMFITHVKNEKGYKEKDISLAFQNKIREQAELAKHHLSLDSNALMNVNVNGKQIEFNINHQDFESGVEPLLQRLRDPIKKVLSDAKLSSTQINQIILVGGASRMPIVKKLVARMFGKLPLCHINPDTVVVQGAAIQAGLKENDKALDDIVVTDVSPYSLGVAVNNETMPGKPGVLHYDPIIERNTIIPTSRSRIYYPSSASQQYVNVQIYQGESFHLEKNVFLGNLQFKMPQGLKNPAIEVRFTYDINGLLEVEATIVETQEKNRMVIEGNAGVLTETQIRESLAALKDLKIHPREATENMLALSSAERLYEDLHGEKRLFLASVIKEFLIALEGQDQKVILKTRKKLEQILLELRSELTTI